MQPNTTVEQQAKSNGEATLPKRSKTRKGKIRLLTLDSLDARTAAYASASKLIETLSVDMGGMDQLSEGEKQLITRAAMIGAIATDFEARWVAGQKVELSDYLQAVNAQRRVLATLVSGLPRRAKDIGPSLGDLLRADHAQQQQQDVLQAAERRRQFEAKQQRQPSITETNDNSK